MKTLLIAAGVGVGGVLLGAGYILSQFGKGMGSAFGYPQKKRWWDL